MNQKKSNENVLEDQEQEFEGAYGKYKITVKDKIEVSRYRIAVLICGASFTSGILQWLTIGPKNAWIWLIAMIISLGFALQLIHIYIKIIHQVLKAFWAIGSIVIVILLLQVQPSQLFASFAENKYHVLATGPFFAALTGLGFKEFFCFRQPEAIGVTLLLPISVLGFSVGIINSTVAMTLLSISSILLLTLGFRKFGMDPAADIGDKSVFDYLASINKASTSSI